MKKKFSSAAAVFILLLLVIIHSIQALASPSDRLINAMSHVESKCHRYAIGDNGAAVGILQIHKEVVVDVNRRYGTSYTLADRKSIVKSREICRKYLLMHAGPNATDEKYARIWNGGPKGHRKQSTKNYWLKVKRKLS